ncbi:MAG: type II secretion system protein [Minisyncoccia bacterium]|jgi:prepilin-type N-terminal cleavage/methylation domain-containing protein
MMKRSFKENGFTLAETLVAVAIFTAVMAAVWALQISIFSNQRTVSGSLQTAQDAETILKTMLTELRAAAPGGNGAYTIASAATNTISFFSDPDDDGQTEKLTYSLFGTNLYRAVIQPSGSPVVYNIASQTTTTLMTNVRNGTSTLVFQYFDQNYTGTSSPLTLPVDIPSVRLVGITLILDVSTNLAPAARTYSTVANLRNLKTNL